MKTKILVADDDPDIIKLLALRLRADNFEVVEASDGMQALAKAHRDHPDLIVLDIMMPAGNGISVHKNLKLSYDTSMIPIIFITAQTNGDIKEKVLSQGARDFIAKPFDTDELIEKINRVLSEDLQGKIFSKDADAV
jgi:DNA-binding response OmpR family regulator